MTYFSHGSTPDNMKKALQANNMALMDDRYFHCGSDLKGNGHPDGLPFFTGVENGERSEYVRYGQRMLLEKIKAKPINETYLYTLPGMIQFRKTRSIIANETFLAEDGKHSDTSIGATGDFRYKDRRFEFPFGMIYNEEFPNILAAGRVAGADDDGWEISRMIPSAALTGEAAGVAAALMIRQGKTAADLNVEDVQKILEKNNVKLRF
jgi:hypothetical protein